MIHVLFILVCIAIVVNLYAGYAYIRRKDWGQLTIITLFLPMWLYMGFSFPYDTEDVVVSITQYEVRECEDGLYLPQFDQTITEHRFVVLYRNSYPDSLIVTTAWSLWDGEMQWGVKPIFH